MRCAESFSCAPHVDTAGQGDACDFDNGCDVGNVCIDGTSVAGCDAGNCCTSLCDLEAPTCPDELSCTAWYEEGAAPEGFQNLGVCVVP